ncbi:hypothetical protein ACFL6C_13310 [Myxococcota bacterium]
MIELRRLGVWVAMTVWVACSVREPTSDQPANSTPARDISELEEACCVGFGLKPDEKACEQLWALGKVPRKIDAAAKTTSIAPPVPKGVVEAEFYLNTGGDQMSCRPVQGGLGVEVRVADKRITQQFASCDHAGHGNAMAPPRALEAADCDGRSYELYLRKDAVVVLHQGRELLSIPVQR